MEMLPEEKVQALLRQYRASLPEKAGALRASLSQFEQLPRREPLSNLRTLVHRLAGSAPLYGFNELGRIARALMHQIDELPLPPPVMPLADLHERVVALAESLLAEAENTGAAPSSSGGSA